MKSRRTGPLAALAAAVVLAAVAAVTLAPSGPAGADPSPIRVPGGLRPGAVPAASGDCGLSGVVCKPARTGSCTGYSSQSTTPATIRVLVRTGTSSYRIDSVPFMTYVENSLPNEWIPSWDGDALRAGAVAVKSYAWYWVTHFGGYVSGYTTGTVAKCFDVTDDTAFQVYRAGSAGTRTTSAVVASWPVALRRAGRIVQASYRAYLNNSGEACGAYADGSTLSQWGSQNCVEANSGNKYNVILQRYYGSDVQLTTTRQQRTQHDFTFTQTATRATYNAGTWSIDDGYPTSFHYGISGDVPAITDQGDGFAHIGVFRPSTGTWYQGSATGGTAAKTQYGARTDVPVAGHWNGAGRPSVLAVYRPSEHTWHVQGRVPVHYGETGDVPVPGDYNGNGTTEVAMYRPSTNTWYVKGHVGVHYGEPGDVPVPADYDGNGTTDIAMYRPATHVFYIKAQTSVHYGAAGDVPVTGDFSGDGRADVAIYRPATHQWWVKGHATRTFGSGTPIGAAPYRA